MAHLYLRCIQPILKTPIDTERLTPKPHSPMLFSVWLLKPDIQRRIIVC